MCTFSLPYVCSSEISVAEFGVVYSHIDCIGAWYKEIQRGLLHTGCTLIAFVKLTYDLT